MPSTPDHNLRYPTADDEPDGPTQMKNLAEDVDAAIAALLADSGVVATLPVTPEPDWSVSANQSRVVGKVMFLQLRFIYGGATITAGGAGDANPGNIADTTVAAIGDASKRPVMDTFGWFRGPGTGGSCQVNADGRVRIVDAHTASTIANGDEIRISAKYPIP